MSHGTLNVLTPILKPAGGLLKLLDYSAHALDTCFEDCVLWAPGIAEQSSSLGSFPVYRRLVTDERFRIRSRDQLALDDCPWILFSHPADMAVIDGCLPDGASFDRVIQLVQGTRNADPAWLGGLGYRVLSRYLSRCFVSEQLRSICQPATNTRSAAVVTPLGHDVDFFAAAQREPRDPRLLRIGYTTWKSLIGRKVERALKHEPRFEFQSIATSASWSELRDLYRSVDVFLCCPFEDEGYYLPGLEAMAAGTAIITPLVGGNKAYVERDTNAIVVPFESVDSYVAALHLLFDDPARLSEVARAGKATAASCSLDEEREAFAAFVQALANSGRTRPEGINRG